MKANKINEVLGKRDPISQKVYLIHLFVTKFKTNYYGKT